MQGRGRARRGALLAAALAVTLGACNLIQPLDPSLEAAFLTADPDDDYGISVHDDATTITARTTNTAGGNTRVAFWPADAPQIRDQQSCMSWFEGSHATQQGVALRARSVVGRTSAITVTKNVWLGFYWVFNVHLMDSGNTERPYILIAQFIVNGSLVRDGAQAPGPWRLCARVVGDVLSVKAWAGDEAVPAWNDTVHGGSVTVPPGWDAPGAAGWYIGHLAPGASTTYTDRAVLDLTAAEEPTTTTTETTEPAATTTTEATVASGPTTTSAIVGAGP